MQKKIIALAVAGLMSGAAFAQSNVEIYGVMGAYWANEKVTTAANATTKTNKLRTDGQSGSRLGFRGTEDLGGGMKAMFVIESGLNVDTAGDAVNSGQIGLGNRQIYVGVGTGFGSVTLGRQYSPMFHLLAGIVDNTGYADWSPVVATQANATRINNAINFTSAAMGGVTVRGQYAFGEDGAAGTKGNGDQLGLGASYAAGPMAAGLAYHQTKAQSVAGPNGNNKVTALGGSFDMGMAKLVGGFTWEKTAANAKTKTYSLGADVKVGGAGTASFSLGNRNPDGASNDTKAYQLSYSHALSKRTNAVAGISRINPDGSADTKWTFAGVRHTF